MTMVDLQGEEGKGEGGREVEAKGEREMVTLAHTLVYRKSWTLHVHTPLPPPHLLCTHTHLREWLYLLSHEMFNPYYGLFEYSAR